MKLDKYMGMDVHQATTVVVVCRCSVILSPLNCPVILSPCRNAEDNHIETAGTKAHVGTESGPRGQVGGWQGGRDIRAEPSADPTTTRRLPKTRSGGLSARQSGTPTQTSNEGSDPRKGPAVGEDD